MIISSLEEKLKTDPKSLVGNKGYRKRLKLDRQTVTVNLSCTGHPEGTGSQVGEGEPLFRMDRHQAIFQGAAGNHD